MPNASGFVAFWPKGDENPLKTILVMQSFCGAGLLPTGYCFSTLFD
jgi:hypothetical protein